MSSSFGGIQSALTGLTTARKALDVVGQNITNSATAGYTRQTANTQAIAATGQVSMQGVADNVGNGVQVTSVGRTSDDLLNAKVNSTAADSALASGRSAVYTSLENLTSEPTDTGLGGQLDTMWNAWGDLSNAASTMVAGSSATTSANVRPVVLQDTQSVVNAIASGYQSVSDQWDDQYKQAQTAVTSANTAATNLAGLNAKIKLTVASGGDANTLMDQRDQLVTSLSTLTGATSQTNADGTVNVYIGGHAMVAEDRAYSLTVGSSSPASMTDGFTAVSGTMQYTNPVSIDWNDDSGADSGQRAAIASGSLGANLDAMNSTLPSAANSYNAVASSLATTVNGFTTTGVDGNGNPGLALFTMKSGASGTAAGVFTAANLQINQTVAADPSGSLLTAAAAGNGPADGSLADTLSRQGTSTTGPNAAWKTYVSDLGTKSSAATLQANLTATAATTATANQQSVAGVSLDEETTNLLTLQRTYQGAAKVLSAMDSLLGDLMNMVG